MVAQACRIAVRYASRSRYSSGSSCSSISVISLDKPRDSCSNRFFLAVRSSRVKAGRTAAQLRWDWDGDDARRRRRMLGQQGRFLLVWGVAAVDDDGSPDTAEG